DVTEGEILNSFKKSAFVFQDARLLPWKNAVENIAMPLAKKDKESLEKASELAIRFGLEKEDLVKYPKDLSGGMKQRVNFARALIIKPDLLFLDEPFSALDVGLKEDLQHYILEANSEELMSVLCITHDLMEAVRLSDSVLLLKSDPGEIVKSYDFTLPKLKRDYTYLFDKTHELLKEDIVRHTFEIKVSL
ncbi:MAG: ATP-binding cassette domain-containing protein, partial [Sulfurospirillaceae bacterium]